MIILYPTQDAVLEINGDIVEPTSSLAAHDPWPVTDSSNWDFDTRPFTPSDQVIAFDYRGEECLIALADIEQALNPNLLATHEHPFSPEALVAALCDPVEMFESARNTCDALTTGE